MLRVNLLGEFRLGQSDGLVTDVFSSRMQSIVAYLLLRRGVPQPRQQLAYMLWPDSTDEQALTNLRKLLHDLRHMLPDADRHLDIGRVAVQWRLDAPLTVDVAEFLSAIEQASKGPPAEALERAISLYRGDLLPACYDDWILPEREQLSQAYISAIERLIDWYEGHRMYRAAITHAQRLLRQDPLNEEGYRTLMRLHALDGDRLAAARVFQTCRDTLRKELGIEPGSETRAVYERLMETPSRLQPEPAAAPPMRLIGRSSGWQQLQRAWMNTMQGQVHCILIEGEAGIGKTRLAEEFVMWAARQGIATATARYYAAEGALPLSPVVAWLRGDALRGKLDSLDEVWLTELARLLPELLVDRPKLPRPGPISESWQRQHLLEALARAILLAQPVLLFLDDLQWCDSETLEWLHFLLRFDSRARLMLVGACRVDELTDIHPLRKFQAALRREEKLIEIELDPLNAAETAELASMVAGRTLLPDEAAHLYRETEGLPLFVVEAVRAADSDAAMPGNRLTTLSPTVQAVIAHRLGQLSTGANDLAALAATVGREFTLDMLADTSASGETTLVRDIDELLLHRIIRERIGTAGGDAYDFSHGKIREVAYGSLSGARRRMLHQRIAKSLETAHAGHLDAYGGQIAWHYEQAGLPERAIGYYQRAAEYARRVYANADAIHYYRRAEVLLPEWPTRGGTQWHQAAAIVCESLGDLLQLTGEYAEAEAAFGRELSHVNEAESATRARVQRKIANTFVSRRDYEAAEQAYRLADAALGATQRLSEADWRHEWIQIQMSRAWMCYWRNRPDDLTRLAEKLRPVLDRYATPAEWAGFYLLLLLNDLRLSRYTVSDEGLGYAREYLEAQQQIDDLAGLALASFEVGFTWLHHGDLDQAEVLMRQSLALAERVGDIAIRTRSLNYLTLVYRKRGAIEQVQKLIDQTLPAAMQAGMPEYIAQCKSNQAWVAWKQGRFDDAEAIGQAALDDFKKFPAGQGSTPLMWEVLFPLLDLALRHDHVPLGVDLAGQLLTPFSQRLPDALTHALEAAIRALTAGDPEAARSHLYESVTLAQQTHFL